MPNTLLVVGSDNPLNIHGLKEFLKISWPIIRNEKHDAILRVIGKIGTNFINEDSRVQIVGWVEDLQREYSQAEIVINPTIAGTGLKIKTVEALCMAKP